MQDFLQKMLSIYRQSSRRNLKVTTRWLLANIEQFSIRKDFKAEVPWQIKPVAELVFLLSAFMKSNLVNKDIERMNHFCLEETKGFDWHELAAYDPSVVTVIYSLNEFYINMGHQVPWESDYIDMLSKADYFEAMDRVPYREMDYIHSTSLTDASVDLDILRDWFQDTAFGQGQHLARYTIDDMYSLTHAVFYLTNMGTRPITWLIDKQTVARMHDTLVSLAVSIARSNNIDVLGELLICWFYAGVPKRKSNALIFQSLMKHILSFQTNNGAVTPNPRVFKKVKEGHVDFYELYHTTLVSALLFASSQRWEKQELICH